ncbi:helix-turn-helix domain-containing protein [Sphingobium fluviale]|uniref:XRE family transcriptional regulator n=1 Tax=Sphingobium fluviale TaxID=2506423 RepID=A0A4Q1KGM5_9SPHN|nr:helix-turn-helix transcriptional regulator [Sphingobium fluviale]RXR28642.1 XRE family transcriptional regulator [Sphingobium fluviale]
MRLDTYIASGVMSAADLARKTGLSAASITRIIQGKQKPSFDAIRSIVEATEGNVSADDLVFATHPQEAA